MSKSDTAFTDLPDPDALRCFVAAAELANFRNAARRVHLTPSAFSKRIAAFESLVGGPLFRRTTRRVELSPLGEALLPRARTALIALEGCVRASSAEAPILQGELSLGSRHELALSWLLPFAERVERSYPGLRIQIAVSSGPDLLTQLLRGELDAFVSSQRFDDRALDFEALHTESYVFVGSSKLLKKNPFRKAADASTHTLIDTARGLPLYRYVREAGGPPAESFMTTKLRGSIALVREQVAAGCGLAVLPEYFVARDLERKQFQRVLPAITLPTDTFRLVFRKADDRRHTLREVASQMRSFALR